jgi:hypothetical protein
MSHSRDSILGVHGRTGDLAGEEVGTLALSRNDQREAQARRGLQAWARFPADRQPRPLILLSLAVQPGGFPDGQTKMAFLHGSIEAATDFPTQVLRALRGQPRPWEGSPLLLASATPGEREFVTDRGRKVLPAWCVRARDVSEPIWVLDPDTSRQSWQPPGQEFRSWPWPEALIGTDGRTLTLSFMGSPKSYTSYPGVRVLESGNAVAVIPVSKELATGPRIAVAHTRQVEATLTRPLGNRVLLDGTGSPVMVTST